MAALLEVRGLTTELRTQAGHVTVVNGVGFSVEAGQTLAIVGESGSGKSMTALSILRLFPETIGEIAGGEVLFAGRDLVRLSEDEMRTVRGDNISMIFQEPMTSLNPVMTIGAQLVEAIREHRPMSRREARREAAGLLALVRIPDPERRLDDYPHRLSGGMRQRVMIAIALACRPKLLIADEPTTALDVTIQAQILDLMRRLQQELGMGIILITHNLGVVAAMADRVAVMYAGRIVEEAEVHELFARPRHPYTRGLLGATPHMEEGDTAAAAAPGRLTDIPGMVPSLADLPGGCAFSPRCPWVEARCMLERPELLPIGTGGLVACHVAHDREKAA